MKGSILRKLIISCVAGAVVASACVGFLFFQLAELESLENTVDLVGSQRTRVLVISEYAITVIDHQQKDANKNETPDQTIIETIKAEVAMFKRINEGLRKGDPDLRIRPQTNPALLSALDKADELWGPFQSGVENIIAALAAGTDVAAMEDAVGTEAAMANRVATGNVATLLASQAPAAFAMIKLFLIGLMVVVGLISLTIILVMRQEIAPIRSLVAALELMATRDFTTGLSASGKGDLGYVADHLAKMQDSIRAFMADVQIGSRNLAAANQTLMSVAEQAGVAGRGLTDAHQKFQAGITAASQSLSQTETAAGALRNGQETLFNLVESQQSAVSESSAGIEEMVASIETVTASTARAKAISGQLKDAAEAGKTRVETTAEVMRSMESAAQSIMESVQGIAKIAASTNLLAMNAAIEAAHAGTAGSGFAVVAQEIRTLAEEAAQGTKKIRDIVGATVASIRRGAMLGQETAASFTDIMASVQTTVVVSSEINASLEEQQQAAKDILRAMGSLSDLTQSIREAAAGQGQTQKGLQTVIADLSAVLQGMAAASTQQGAAGSELERAIGSLREVAATNRESVEKLEAKLGEFKT